ncbi:Signal transduction histidine kinase [Actinacidiphila yanglinensis]|uniref:histidine kinase n=1 Tax=Actinacidiphila yanglinensis TaxID=310779 RepID=A0A1H6E6U1_9ACTN|nr:histidine kinase [Actinacidiphila yanglinensis]SEG92889.1 Signal transduction histidine kinase [Actinacidiphila yanglinensis]
MEVPPAEAASTVAARPVPRPGRPAPGRGAPRTPAREWWRWGPPGRRLAAGHGPVDALLALTLCAFFTALQHGAVRAHPLPVLLAQVGLIVPLAWRRRAPMTVFGVMAAAAFAQWLGDVRSPADGGLLIALYTVAAYVGERARLLAAFGVLEAGIALATLRWSIHDRGLATFVSLSAMATAAGVIGTNMRARRERMEFLEDRAVRLELERDQRAQLAVAGERARIAREMHDIVTHNLSVMVALADGAAFAMERSPDRAATAMRQTSATGRQAITDMRRFLGVLRDDEPDALRHPMPGIAQLDALAEQVRAAGLPTRLVVAGEPAAVPAAAQLTAFRLVQEALTNTLKHAPAGARAEVRLSCGPDVLEVSVMDDGAGTEPQAPPGPPPPLAGHGLAGMRERAAAYGGRLTAGPRPGGGWRVTAVLALATPEAP